MDIIKAVYLYLNSSVINNEVNGNIFTMHAKEEISSPYIVISPVSCRYDEALGRETRFVSQNIQFNVYSSSFKSARNLSRQVRNLFKDFCGDMNGVDVGAVHSVMDVMQGVDEEVMQGQKLYCSVIELQFDFKEE